MLVHTLNICRNFVFLERKCLLTIFAKKTKTFATANVFCVKQFLFKTIVVAHNNSAVLAQKQAANQPQAKLKATKKKSRCFAQFHFAQIP